MSPTINTTISAISEHIEVQLALASAKSECISGFYLCTFKTVALVLFLYSTSNLNFANDIGFLC